MSRRRWWLARAAVLSIACFGNQAWALRLPAALFGVLTVAELFGDWVGLLAAFFLATSFGTWCFRASSARYRCAVLSGVVVVPAVGCWCWLAIGALPAVPSGQDLPHALRSILMLPAAMLLAALGAHGAYEYLAEHRPRGVVTGVAAFDSAAGYVLTWSYTASKPPGISTMWQMRIVRAPGRITWARMCFVLLEISGTFLSRPSRRKSPAPPRLP